eukprot:3657244-Rhodomonas_salina.2
MMWQQPETVTCDISLSLSLSVGTVSAPLQLVPELQYAAHHDVLRVPCQPCIAQPVALWHVSLSQSSRSE